MQKITILAILAISWSWWMYAMERPYHQHPVSPGKPSTPGLTRSSSKLDPSAQEEANEHLSLEQIGYILACAQAAHDGVPLPEAKKIPSPKGEESEWCEVAEPSTVEQDYKSWQAQQIDWKQKQISLAKKNSRSAQLWRVVCGALGQKK